MVERQDTVDVVIAGGGMAGLSAAIAAAESGVKVLVLEKAAGIGGNAALSAGMLLGTDDYKALRSYIPDGDPALQRMLTSETYEAIEWLEGHGLPVGEPAAHGGFRVSRPMGLGEAGNRVPFLAAMAKRAMDSGAEIVCDAPVTALNRYGAIVAVEAPARRYEARAVVLATGGFQANRALIARYIGPDAAASLRLRSRPEAQGDGLSLALNAGAAASRNMDKFYGHSMIDCPLPPTQFQKLTPYFARAAVLVNRDGRRFVDESDTFIEEGNAQAACHQWGGVFYVIFDQRMYEIDRATGEATHRTMVPNWLGMIAPYAPPLWAADTIEALIAELVRDGLPAATLREELERYNRACHDGTAARLAPPRTDHVLPLEVPPFRAVRCVPGITATAGGIAVDDHLRVLDATRSPLPGLFAAGVDAGGVYGRTYGGFLGWSLVSGRKAGRSAAAFVGNRGN